MKNLATICLALVLGFSSAFGAPQGKRAAASSPSLMPQGAELVQDLGVAPVCAKEKFAGLDALTDGKARLHQEIGAQVKSIMKKEGSTGATVLGFLGYDETAEMTMGLREVLLDGGNNPYFGFSKGPNGYSWSPITMFIRDNKVYLLGDEFYVVWVMAREMLVYDFDGNLLSTEDLGEVYYTHAAYDPTEDMVYGLISSSDGYYFGKSPGDNPTDVTVVAQTDLTSTHCITVNQITGDVIAVTGDGRIVKFDKTDGSYTELATLANHSSAISGIAYSPMDRGYYYGVVHKSAEGPSSIDLLDENDFSVKQSTSYGRAVEWFGMACTDTRRIDENAPGYPTLVNTVFPNGATSGSLTYRLASENAGGTPILGDINWDLEIDGVLYKHGVGPAGGNVTIPVENLEEGNHTFTLKCSVGNIYGRYHNTTFYVGNDTPCAPTNVVLTEETITWDAVTTGANQGYINPAEVTYNVYLNNTLLAKDLTETSCTTVLPQNTTLDAYVASVEAVFKGKKSERGYSNDIAYGEPFEAPCAWEPTQKQSTLFTIVDSNNDASTFKFMPVSINGLQTAVFYYTYSADNDADDWLFMPPVKMNATDAYSFSLNSFRTYDLTENYEFVLCTSPDPATRVRTIMPTTALDDDVSAGTFDHTDIAYFSAPEDGTYYIGVHATSPADAAFIYTRDYMVDKPKGMSASSPKAAEDVSAVAAEQGGLYATVTYKFPTASIDGAEYPAGKALTAKLKAPGASEVTIDGVAGKTVTATVPTLQGDNIIDIVVYDGDLKGVPTSVSIYTGIDTPGLVENFTGRIDADSRTMHLQWDAPSTGANGGYVAPTGITYYLCEYLSGQWYLVQEIGTDIFSYDAYYQGDALAYSGFGIATSNLAGMSGNLRGIYDVMGNPNEVPFESNYKTGKYLTPVMNYGANGQSVTWYYGVPGSRLSAFKTSESARAFYLYATGARTNAKITLPRFSTVDSHNTHFQMNIWGQSCKEFSVYARTVGEYTSEEELLATYTKSDLESGPNTIVDIELPEKFQNKGWVEISIHATTSARTESFILYSYKAYDALDNDFAVTALKGATGAKMGVESKFTAQVANRSILAQPYQGGTWKVTDENGEVLAQVDTPATTEAVEPDEVLTYEISIFPTADYPGQIYVSYTNKPGDEKDVNDSLSREVAITKGATPVITDLNAQEITNENVRLAWSPISAGSTIESFENAEPWIFDEESSTVGVFKRYDGDGSHVYGSNTSAYRALPHAFDPQSFVVWSQNDMESIVAGGDVDFAPYTGDKYLVAFCPEEPEDGSETPTADDWLISPEVAPGSEFSFFAKALAYDYGAEVLEVMYSTTDDDIDSFKVLETVYMDGEASETPLFDQYRFTLPADAKYFALHYVSHNVFGIIIDDIEYVDASATATVTGYNIYRNGEVIASNDACTGETYNDTTVAENTQYSYIVVPLMSNGVVGLDSNTLLIRTTGVGGIATAAKAIYASAGAIVVKGYEGEPVIVTAADGKTDVKDLKAAAAETYPVAPGVYIVKAGSDIVKLIVK